MRSGDTVVLSAASVYVAVRLPPSLHPTFGPTLSVAVGPSGTVDDVAEVVEEHTGVAVDLLTLSADGEGELSGSTTLGELGVLSNGGALDLTLASTPAAPAEVVKVMLPPSLQPSHGPSIVIALPLASTVDELKTAIESITGMTRAEQELALGGFALLSGAQSLEGAGLRSGDRIFLCSTRSMSCPYLGTPSLPPSSPPLLPLNDLSENFSRSIEGFPLWLTLTVRFLPPCLFFRSLSCRHAYLLHCPPLNLTRSSSVGARRLCSPLAAAAVASTSCLPFAGAITDESRLGMLRSGGQTYGARRVASYLAPLLHLSLAYLLPAASGAHVDL